MAWSRPGLRCAGVHQGDPDRYDAMVAAAEAAGREALDEALLTAKLLGITAHIILEHSKPEQMLVRLAREGAVDIIALRAREWREVTPPLGPRSVGHIARFVLDHAPCDVLLVRWEASIIQ